MEIERLEELVEQVQSGAVLLFPTDTCFGIGCSITNREAIERVFTLKGRERSKPVPVLGLRRDLENVVDLPQEVHPVLDRFWPGALSVVAPVRTPNDWSELLMKDGTMAVRDPGFDPLRELLGETGPLVGTSANLSGHEPPVRLEDVHPELLRAVDAVVGEEAGGQESSTVAEWTHDRGWNVHREGPVSRDDLERIRTFEDDM